MIYGLGDTSSLDELVCQNKTTFGTFFEDVVERQKSATHSVFSIGMVFDKALYKLSALPAHLIAERDKLLDELVNRLQNK